MEQHPIPQGGEQPTPQSADQLPPQAPYDAGLSAVEEQGAAAAPTVELPAANEPVSVLAAIGKVAGTSEVQNQPVVGRHETAAADARGPAQERRSNKDILAAAKKTIEVIADQVRRNENLPGIRELAEHFVVSDDMQAPPYHLYRALAACGGDLREVMASAADNAVFRLWSRSKVVYAMDDLLLQYLSESSTSRIPTQVLRSLPHADPYLLLPKPDFTDAATSYYRTHIGVPLGAFVFGRYNQAQQLCSSADGKRQDLGLMFVGFIDREGIPDPVTLRCTIPLQGSTFTVEDAVSATIAKFNFTDDLAEDDPAKLETWLRTYVAQAFNSLLYVCTEQPDIEAYRPGATRSGKPAKSRERRRPRPADIDQVVKLGFRMGPALHQARAQWERSQQQSAANTNLTGRRVRPHQKKGHYRTYWTGAGRVEPIMRWIAPFWVNEKMLSEADEPRDAVVWRVKPRT